MLIHWNITQRIVGIKSGKINNEDRASNIQLSG